jgi:cell division protein FtsQ
MRTAKELTQSLLHTLRQFAKGVILLLSGAVLVGAIVFAEQKQAGKACQYIHITIGGDPAQRFVVEQHLLNQLTTHAEGPILGASLQTVKTRGIANTINADSFVHAGVVYKNWRGTLRVNVLPRRPIARILYPHQPSQYIDEEGRLLPLSGQYTARVLLVEKEAVRNFSQNIKEDGYGTELLALLNYIDRNPFWRGQIAHMRIDKKGKIVMNTQISKQCVEFGYPEEIEVKFAKLMLFYKKIVPYKGWNTYKRINLEFDRQIVCE